MNGLGGARDRPSTEARELGTVRPPHPGAPGAMRALARLLRSVGYPRLYPLVTGGALFAPTSAAGEATLAGLVGLTDEERATLALFSLGAVAPHMVADARSGDALHGVVRALQSCGLVHGGPGERLATSGWVVAPALGGLLLTGRPPSYSSPSASGDHPDGLGASAYLGPDSLTFAASIPDARGLHVLDLGAGCGIQGLLAARGASEVLLSDVEERSLELAALNALLNDTPHPVRYALSDCFDALAGETFDLVVTLPPYVPAAPGTRLRSTVAAGPDGLGVIRRVLAGAVAHLRPGGTLVARCQLICDDRGPILLRELGALSSGLAVRLTLGETHPLQPYVAELAASVAAHGGAESFAAAYAAYQASLRGLGATGVCGATVEATRTACEPDSGRDSHAPVRVVAAPGPRTRLAPAPGLVLEADPTARVARADGVGAVLLDGPSAALLAAVDGRRGPGELAEHAWGSPRGASGPDLTDQARARLAQLARHGLVTPVAPEGQSG